MEDEVAIQSEIDSLISSSITAVDETEIEAELAALVAAQSENIPNLPNVPATEPDLSLPSVPVQAEESTPQTLLAA